MGTPLYLDHAATAPPLPEALETYLRTAREAFANPSSLHGAGAAAARVLEHSRLELRAALGAGPCRVVWTATGTESNHLGIQGLARALRRRVRGRPQVLVGAAEHPSSLRAALALEAEGFSVVMVPVDPAGIVQPDALAARLGPEVVLVSVQWANNELGGLNPVAALAALVRERAPEAAFHVDAVQAAGKTVAGIESLLADSVAVAAHKIGGLRGCAALLLREDGPLPLPLLVGGGHEGGLRSGTENVAGAAAFAAAAVVRRKRLDADPQRYRRRRRELLAVLREAAAGLVVLGPEAEEDLLGSILAVAAPGLAAEPLLHHLEAAGVWVSSGSACHARGHDESPVLAAIGLDPALRGSVLRFSLDGSEGPADLQRAGVAFARAVAALGGARAPRRDQPATPGFSTD